MGIKEFFKKKILGIPEIHRTLAVELPSEAEKRKIAQIRLLNEKIRDLEIENRKLRKEVEKVKVKEKKTKEEKKIIKEVLKKSKKAKKVSKTKKVIYKLEYPKRPYIEYANGQRRILEGFEINETKDGIPMFRLRFYAPEVKKVIPLQLDAPELTFFFKNIIGLVSQHHTKVIQLNVDEIDGKPVFINSELDYLKSSDVVINRLNRQLARKDEEIRRLRNEMGKLQELQAEQEKELADRDMALKFAKKDAEDSKSKLESVMNIYNETLSKVKSDHIQKGLTELKMAQAIRTAGLLQEANEEYAERLRASFSSDAYELGKQDAMDMIDKITKNILSIQSATKQIDFNPQPTKIVRTEKKEVQS